MCGIFGVILKQNNAEQVRTQLAAIYENQKSRGTEGFGYAILRAGKVIRERSTIEKGLVKDGKFVGELKKGDIVIAHNRTPTSTPNLVEANHPITGCGKVWLVHNGWVTNDASLRKKLEKKKHSFETVVTSTERKLWTTKGKTYYNDDAKKECITDSEVLAHLLEGRDVKALAKAQGRYALAWFFPDDKRIHLFSEGNPVKVFKADGNLFFGSEMPSVGFDEVVTLNEDGEYGALSGSDYTVFITPKVYKKPVTVCSGESSIWRKHDQEDGTTRYTPSCVAGTAESPPKRAANASGGASVVGDEVERDIKSLLKTGFNRSQNNPQGYYLFTNPEAIENRLKRLIRRHVDKASVKLVNDYEGIGRDTDDSAGVENVPCEECKAASSVCCAGCGQTWCDACWLREYVCPSCEGQDCFVIDEDYYGHSRYASEFIKAV